MKNGGLFVKAATTTASFLLFEAVSVSLRMSRSLKPSAPARWTLRLRSLLPLASGPTK